MDPTPVVVEAVKFVLHEAGKWIDELRDKGVASKHENNEIIDDEAPLTEREMAAIAADPGAYISSCDPSVLATDVYVISGLVEQIRIHRRSLTDLERTESEFGALTPPHVKRAIERERIAIIEKVRALKGLLARLYRAR